MNYEDELDRSRARKSRRRESESETSAKRRTHRTEDLYSMSADPGSRAGRAAAKSHTTAARYFTAHVDSAAVYVNASTRFTDGGEFGLGCEMGISTQKLHARGPLGLEELCSYKYVIEGNGQVR